MNYGKDNTGATLLETKNGRSSHYIKCPQCNEEAYRYLEDFRRRLHCPSCGYDTYLKLISIEEYDKTRTP